MDTCDILKYHKLRQTLDIEMIHRFCNSTDIKAISQEFLKSQEHRLVGVNHMFPNPL